VPALPTFIVIGAMKCGTTSLHEYLAQHPDFSMSDPKEVNYFSGEHADEPLEWYTALFDETKPFRGESSQNYSKRHVPIYAGAPARIRGMIPDCKLIYLVRDPLPRYQSHISEQYFGETKADIEWSVANNHYVKTGLYHYQLTAFLEHFPLEQIHVVDAAHLQADRLATMNEIFRFLGAEQVTDPALFDFKANALDSKTAPRSVRLSLPYRAAEKIAPQLTAKVFQSSLVRDTFFPGAKRQELSATEIASLKDQFKPDIDQFRALLDRDFASWSV